MSGELARRVQADIGCYGANQFGIGYQGTWPHQYAPAYPWSISLTTGANVNQKQHRPICGCPKCPGDCCECADCEVVRLRARIDELEEAAVAIACEATR